MVMLVDPIISQNWKDAILMDEYLNKIVACLHLAHSSSFDGNFMEFLWNAISSRELIQK